MEFTSAIDPTNISREHIGAIFGHIHWRIECSSETV